MSGFKIVWSSVQVRAATCVPRLHALLFLLALVPFQSDSPLSVTRWPPAALWGAVLPGSHPVGKWKFSRCPHGCLFPVTVSGEQDGARAGGDCTRSPWAKSSGRRGVLEGNQDKLQTELVTTTRMSLTYAKGRSIKTVRQGSRPLWSGNLSVVKESHLLLSFTMEINGRKVLLSNLCGCAALTLDLTGSLLLPPAMAKVLVYFCSAFREMKPSCHLCA